MIGALIKRVSVTYKCYEMYAHRGKSEGNYIIVTPDLDGVLLC
jgi:hypothetical protein